jgi:hypothetical protein
MLPDETESLPDPARIHPLQKGVILRACDFFDRHVFFGFDQLFLNPPKSVILSEAPRRSIAYQRVYGAKSKDPGGAFLPVPLGAFQPPKPRTGRTRHRLSLRPGTRTASISLCRVATSTSSAAIQGRFTLASPANYICASSNIRRAPWKVSPRPMAASACFTLKVTMTFEKPSLGKNNSKAGDAKKSSISFAPSIPSSKTLHRPGDGR